MPEITRSKARKIIASCVAKGSEMGLQPLSVIILDAGGHPKAFEREDGAAPGQYLIAQGKAYGAVMLGLGGQAQMERAERQTYLMASINGVFKGKTVPVPGGVLVLDKRGVVMGAVGVTGDTSNNDMAVAIAGIEAAGLKAQG